jgi:hypothetical protein
VYGIGSHNADNARLIGDIFSRKRAGTLACDYIMNLYLSGMGMVTDGTAGIDSNMMEAHASTGIAAGDKVPEKDTGKLRVRLPCKAVNCPARPAAGNRMVPCRADSYRAAHNLTAS